MEGRDRKREMEGEIEREREMEGEREGYGDSHISVISCLSVEVYVRGMEEEIKNMYCLRGTYMEALKES